ncbi:glutamine synthetase family protein [Leucobacter sp. UT-8R-CII-1-4]|uniref:glutamine synthetase family protein n=1 Tax=Leucobacter sp. UT-8R-CII-1-4 TaxID=3040075 RepID=UPI0024A90C75|nr:glutamine synthetase family protein [Leucobacter sp. UT-8R-CII-1-4]MDI6023519.1 glutamine synthetase family protein [Leucobacter sp. UT-8R-CII-1-4]
MSDYLLNPDTLEAEGIHTVIVATPDMQGRLIGRRIPVKRFPTIIKNGVEVCTCAWAWDIEQSFELISANKVKVCSLHNGAPDVALMPDLGTLRRAAWLDGIAICMADPVWPGTGEPLEESPRTMLRREVERYRELGLKPKAGTELEFYLFRNDPYELRLNDFRDLKPTTLTPNDFLLGEGNYYEPFFRKLRNDLELSGIEIEAAQSEWGSGQWEMTFEYGDPLEMADRHAIYKLAVRDSARAAGYSVTFMAKPVTEQAGSSCHVHFSVLDEQDRPAFWDADGEYGMSDKMRHALAGVIEHTPEFMAAYAPTINSYRRTATDDTFDFGRSWGRENRYVSNRVVGHSEFTTRFEFRIPGADTNPYLTLVGILASARDGMQRKIELGMPTVGVPENVCNDSAMPQNLKEATVAMEQSSFVAEVIGEDCKQLITALAEHEWRTAAAAVTDWDRARYFDRI